MEMHCHSARFSTSYPPRKFFIQKNYPGSRIQENRAQITDDRRIHSHFPLPHTRHSGPARSVGCRNLWKFLQGVPHLRHPGFGPPPHPCSAHRLHTRHSDSAPFPHSRHPGFLAQPKRPGSSVQEARMQSQVARSSTPFPVAKGNVHEIKAKTIEDPGLPAWQRETGMTGVE